MVMFEGNVEPSNVPSGVQLSIAVPDSDRGVTGRSFDTVQVVGSIYPTCHVMLPEFGGGRRR